MTVSKRLLHAMDALSWQPGEDYHRQVRWTQGTGESNLYQRSVDYPGEFANGYRVILNTEEMGAVRLDQIGQGR